MAADYDRLFQPPAGGEIPDAAGAEPDFDIDSDFDIDAPAAAPPVPTSPLRPNGHAPQPMPVDWSQQPPPARPQPPVDWHEPPAPARPEIPRPPMPVDYDRIFQPSEEIEDPDEAAGSDFDVNSGFDVAAPPMPAGPFEPNGNAPPMPVDWGHQPPPARPQTPRPPMPIGRNDQPPPPRPKPPPIKPGPPPAARSGPARRARQGPGDPEPTRGPTANSPHSHRAEIEHNRGKPVPTRMPARPRTDASPPMPPTGHGAAQQESSMPPAPADRRAPGAVSHIAVKPAKKSAEKLISRRGWRRWVHKLTRINVGLSRAEKYDLDVRDRIRRSPRGAYQIAILGLKGGVGKTTVTVTAGSVFAQVRRDRILAFDADASCGNLADRAGRQSGATIADLLADKDLTHYNDIRAHTSANAVNLEVLPGQDYTTARRAFSEADWHYAADAVSKFYNLVLADCGAGLFDPVTRGVLSTVAAVVIVTNASIDGARQAAVAIDWMRNNGHQDLLSRACVVINNVSPGETNIAVAELVRQFEQYVHPGRVIVLPWDKHIAAGTEIQLSLLDPLYKGKILELAAALSDDFDRGERR
jgi:MinD-like ATPase involved in chromosome partitioning or flagellar assembly